MAATNFQRFPSPNSKYPFVGPNYMQHGEVKGYVYYPYNDQYYINPKDVQNQYEEEGLIEKPKDPSLLEELGPVAGTMIAIEGGRQIGKELPGLMGLGDKPIDTGLNGGGSGVPTIPPAGSAGPVPAGSAQNGGTRMSDGSTVMPDNTVVTADGATIRTDGTVEGGTSADYGQYMQYATYILAAYSMYDTLSDKDLSDEEKGIAVGQAGTAAAQAYTGGSPYLTAVQLGLGAYQTLNSDTMTGEQQATRLQQQAALTAADYFTGGLASLAEGVLRRNNTTGEWLGKLDKLDQKYNPATKLIAGFMSSKDADQMNRDRGRKYGQEIGLVDDDWDLTLADGAKFDIGRDGSENIYDIDPASFDDPVIANAIGLMNPLAAIVGGGDQKLTSDFGGYFTNAVASQGKDPGVILANARAQYQNAGLDRDKAFAAIGELEKQGRIDKATADAYRNGINTVFGSQGATTPNAQQPPTPAPTAPQAQASPQPTQSSPPMQTANPHPTAAPQQAAGGETIYPKQGGLLGLGAQAGPMVAPRGPLPNSAAMIAEQSAGMQQMAPQPVGQPPSGQMTQALRGGLMSLGAKPLFEGSNGVTLTPEQVAQMQQQGLLLYPPGAVQQSMRR